MSRGALSLAAQAAGTLVLVVVTVRWIGWHPEMTSAEALREWWAWYLVGVALAGAWFLARDDRGRR